MEYFPEVNSLIPYEGAKSKNPLAFKYYNPLQQVGSQTMGEHLKFAAAYWHTMKGTGADQFGDKVYDRLWNASANPMDRAKETMDAAFEFFTKLGIKYWCFHDRDIAPEGNTIAESNRNLQIMVDNAGQYQEATGIKLLWNTANLFSHPRYTNGAATNPNPLVFAYAASQIRRAMDAAVQLGGSGYVFWGGREGYISLINTDMKQERKQLARMLHFAVEYGKEIGFNGKFFVEPKPREPSTHQYDFDAAAVIGFLREFDLLEHFQLNIEANHATLATHTFQHEMQVAADAGMLGSLDINRGDLTCGWDTDQFPTNIYDAVWAMYIILRQNGLTYGGLNFDAHVRRSSVDTLDLFYAHIGGMDTFARGLIVAHKLLEDRVLIDFLQERYQGFRGGTGKKIMEGTITLPELEQYAITNGEPPLISGRQELLENILNQYILES